MIISELFLSIAIIFPRNQKAFAQQSTDVYPQVYEERKGKSEKLLVIEEGYFLNLQKASVLSETVLLRDVTEDGIIDKYVHGVDYERHLYQDTACRASLLVTPSLGGQYEIRGLLNSTHHIEPAIINERSSAKSILHHISKVPVQDGIYAVLEEYERKPEERSFASSGGARHLPKKFTIELYFLSDAAHTKKFGNNNTARVNYVTVFMLSVSLHLQQLHPPGSIRIKAIQGTFVKKQPYVNLTRDGSLLADETLVELSKHTLSGAILHSDAFYMATGRDVVYHHNGRISSAALGLAYVKGACKKNQKFAIGEDKAPWFSGVHTAVHEIGHLLGARHDGENNSCHGQHGYIMNPSSGGIRSYLFSACSKRAFHDFLRSKDSSCLKHFVGHSRIVDLPADQMPSKGVLNGTQYCKEYFPKRSAKHVPDGMVSDSCHFRCKLGKKVGEPDQAEVIAPDGILCDERDPKKKCRSGVCTLYEQ